MDNNSASIETIIVSNQSITAIIEYTESLVGAASVGEVIIGEVAIGSSVPVDYYTGSYTVTPSMDASVLKTKSKMMTDNVTVKAIPVYEVSNPQGGKTIYIGGEYNYG